ncbi:MAG TPA: hypothetical protein VMW41_02955 [Candidatus Bathyarchaeia archaeon]|nr:hypothetical protein [Candidatus Bathyarchaeia archaeon]
MIDQIGKFLEEYGWTCKDFKSPRSAGKFVLTYVNPDFDKTLKVLILFKEVGQWLYVSTHKLFKYPVSQTEVIMRFLKFNSQIPLVKWFTRDIKDEIFINIGFEIHVDDFNKEVLFKNLDTLSYYIDDTLGLLKRKGVLTEKNLTRVETVTKDSLELG